MSGLEEIVSNLSSHFLALWANPPVVLGTATLLGALAMWLMLPGGGTRSRVAGALLAAVSLALIAGQLPHSAAVPGRGMQAEPGMLAERKLESDAGTCVFFILAGVTVAAAAAAVTFRNPVYCAIWFGLSLLGTAGLFLFQGAQFLGVATVVVYAGAILVTFLFVLMLAQPGGQAPYDRVSWERLLAACTGALLVGLVTLTVVTDFQKPERELGLRPPADSAARANQLLANQHVARLGAQLFSRHLVAVEVAGTLLLVALVGAIAIATQVAQVHAQPPRAAREPIDMDEMALLENYLVVGALLFSIGLVGFISRRNMIVMFLSAEMMLQGVSVSLVAWGRYHNDWGGQMLVIFILTIAACEAAIALALMVVLFQRSGSLDIAFWQQLREENQPGYVDHELPVLSDERSNAWPHLPPAGIEPPVDVEEVTHRGHV